MNYLAPLHTSADARPFKYKKVMIIDDSDIDRYVCDRVSRTFSFSEVVIGLESAIDALAYLKALQNQPHELPELIFLDINMPEMNGFEFLAAYEELPEVIRKNCIIVMLTSSTHDSDRKRVEGNMYVRGYLNKPLTKENLGKLK